MEEGFAQFIEREVARDAGDGALALAIAVDDALHTLCGDGVGVVHQLDTDEAAVTAVSCVGFENCMGGGSGSREGVQNDGIGVGGYLKDALDKAGRLGRVKCSGFIEDFTDFQLSICILPCILIGPKCCRDNSLLSF